MLQIKDTLLSDNVIEKHFVCNIEKCKGACCIHGDSGAPLTEEEKEYLNENINNIIPFLRKEGIDAVTEKGVSYIDSDHDLVTTLINGNECAFTVISDNGIVACGIEKAFEAGKSELQKPVSCHLYPIRVKHFTQVTGVNYDEWDICKSALKNGKKTKTPLYKFLKIPLIRKFGKEWYEELEQIAELYLKEKKNNR